VIAGGLQRSGHGRPAPAFRPRRPSNPNRPEEDTDVNDVQTDTATDTATDTQSDEQTGPGINTILTHIALPVRNLDAQLAFYAKYTNMVSIFERVDPETNLRTAWIANRRDLTEAAARFVIVLIEGSIPRDVVGDEMKEEYTFLTSFSHLGISVDTREEVDRIAAMAKEDGTLVLGPMYRNAIVGYICLVRDPDGNNVEFSVEQVLG
jgi:catechol 2,3-dioxygenase-like lactoylglutathione lyase family enzyme